MKSKIGPVTAYADAVQAGYTGTREEFGRQQAEFAKNAASVEQAKTEVNQAIESFGQTANAAKQDVILEGDKQIRRIEDAAPDLEMDREQIRKNTQDIISKITNPPNGTTGQVLTKTENGEEWKTPTGGGSGSESPHIGDNGNWYIGETDTGVKAQGSDGDDGISPHIGENGHWYIGDTDTGVTAHGTDGYTPQKGIDYFDGEPGKNGKSAYEYAQEGGYTGTEEEFKEKLATEYPTDVQINGTSIVEGTVANIPIDSSKGINLYGKKYSSGECC